MVICNRIIERNFQSALRMLVVCIMALCNMEFGGVGRLETDLIHSFHFQTYRFVAWILSKIELTFSFSTKHFASISFEQCLEIAFSVFFVLPEKCRRLTFPSRPSLRTFLLQNGEHSNCLETFTYVYAFVYDFGSEPKLKLI